MPDPNFSAGRVPVNSLFKGVKLAYGPPEYQVPLIKEHHPGGVISPVFQFLQSGHEDLNGLVFSDIAYDPAHLIIPL
jgi:hypothetical protein